MYPSPACLFLPIPMSILITHYHLDYLYLSLPNLSHFLALLHSVYPPCPALPMLIPFLADPSPTDCSPCLYPLLHIPTTTYPFICSTFFCPIPLPFSHFCLSLPLQSINSPCLSIFSVSLPLCPPIPLSAYLPTPIFLARRY